MLVPRIALLAVLVLVCGVSPTDGHAGFCPSCSKITVGRWMNLLRYAQKSLTPEPVSDHETHLNATEHVQLIANSIIKHFFNDIFTANVTDDGRVLWLRESRAVDFLILLDSSASISSNHFQQALETLKSWVSIIPSEDFGSDIVRISMISFSEPDRVYHEFPFSPAQEKTDVLDKIESTAYHNGALSSTALALRYAEREFRTKSRRNATKVLLLATDGWSNDQTTPFGVLWPAAKLRVGLGVQVFVLGIGSQVNHNELEAIASRPAENHLFEVADYEMMNEVMDAVKQLNDENEQRYHRLPK